MPKEPITPPTPKPAEPQTPPITDPQPYKDPVEPPPGDPLTGHGSDPPYRTSQPWGSINCMEVTSQDQNL